MTYLDGCVIPVPSAGRAAFLDHARAVAALLREHGATRVFDGWGDDVPEGKVTDFRRSVAATADETIVFSFIEWPSKQARDAAWPKVMEDPRMHAMPPPFDGKRMIYGGFEALPTG